MHPQQDAWITLGISYLAAGAATALFAALTLFLMRSVRNIRLHIGGFPAAAEIGLGHFIARANPSFLFGALLSVLKVPFVWPSQMIGSAYLLLARRDTDRHPPYRFSAMLRGFLNYSAELYCWLLLSVSFLGVSAYGFETQWPHIFAMLGLSGILAILIERIFIGSHSEQFRQSRLPPFFAFLGYYSAMTLSVAWGLVAADFYLTGETTDIAGKLQIIANTTTNQLVTYIIENVATVFDGGQLPVLSHIWDLSFFTALQVSSSLLLFLAGLRRLLDLKSFIRTDEDRIKLARFHLSWRREKSAMAHASKIKDKPSHWYAIHVCSDLLQDKTDAAILRAQKCLGDQTGESKDRLRSLFSDYILVTNFKFSQFSEIDRFLVESGFNYSEVATIMLQLTQRYIAGSHPEYEEWASVAQFDENLSMQSRIWLSFSVIDRDAWLAFKTLLSWEIESAGQLEEISDEKLSGLAVFTSCAASLPKNGFLREIAAFFEQDSVRFRIELHTRLKSCTRPKRFMALLGYYSAVAVYAGSLDSPIQKMRLRAERAEAILTARKIYAGRFNEDVSLDLILSSLQTQPMNLN
ncbi:MAG: hypothetical protein AAGB04_18400 [Pseudomonadota bacterium]